VFGVAPAIVHHMWPTSRAKFIPDTQQQQEHAGPVQSIGLSRPAVSVAVPEGR